MGLKDWPYWLKGGIISLIFGLMDIILIFSFPQVWCKTGSKCPSQPFIGKIATIILLPLERILDLVSNDILMLFIILIYFFIIGSIIGFIIGKIKSSN